MTPTGRMRPGARSRKRVAFSPDALRLDDDDVHPV